MYYMRFQFLLWLLICSWSVGFAQTNISGVINKYAGVTGIDFCNNQMSIDNTTGFFTGQKVLIIQMKGASLVSSNTALCGDVSNNNGCGNYEINEIKNITGNTIEFKFAIIRHYDAGGSVQLVSLEEYSNAVVSSPLTAAAWNGTTGGVVLLKANTLTLNSYITVSGKGFRGAKYENDNAGQACVNNGTGGATDYFCNTVYCGAPKGEGIGNIGSNYGRGKNGNGGGGGDDHNTGGGGGSNFGAGGTGGTRSNTGNFSCPGPAPGIGGVGLSYSNALNKIFMGGGGGAGDGNNNEATGGANGGGIIILIANTLNSNSQKIFANGLSVDTLARSDGAGGGGGAGTVLLAVDSYNGNLQVNVIGGNGGVLDNGGSTGSNAFCMGPGGGGGGGVLWVKGNSVPAAITLVDTGGVNGKNVFGLGPPNCPYGTTNGAQRGNDGNSLTDLKILTDSVEFVKLTATACCDTIVCAGATVFMHVVDTATFPPTLLWSTGDTTHHLAAQVFSTTSFTVTATDLHGCTVTNTMVATVQNTLPDVTVCCDTTVCMGASASFTVNANGTGSYNYSWSSGEHTTGITKQILGSQAFFVTVTDENGCSVEKSVIALVGNQQLTLNVCCDTLVCYGEEVVMTATSPNNVNYQWSTGQTTATILQQVNGSTTFVVTVTDVNGCEAVKNVNAFTQGTSVTVTANPDTAILPGQSVQLTAMGNTFISYAWSPQAGLSQNNVFNPVATPANTTIYCVTVTDNNTCTTTACDTVRVIQSNVVIKIPDAFSPNGDTKNDVFTIFPIDDALILDITIYNRWGEVVFYTEGNVAWDGLYQGKLQASGSYVCKINYTSTTNNNVIKTEVKSFILVR